MQIASFKKRPGQRRCARAFPFLGFVIFGIFRRGWCACVCGGEGGGGGTRGKILTYNGSQGKRDKMKVSSVWRAQKFLAIGTILDPLDNLYIDLQLLVVRLKVNVQCALIVSQAKSVKSVRFSKFIT